MKSLAHKLLAFTFVIALFTGCASVTDANLAQPEQEKEMVVDQPIDRTNSTEADMRVIYDKPTW